MAANDYYNTGPAGAPDRFDTVSPVSQSPYSSSSAGNVHKPLPNQPTHQTSFPPTHAGTYNDDLSYAPHHYSQHSIDTGYHPHSYDGYNDSSSKYNDNDDIPLHATGQKPHMASLESGGGGSSHFSPDRKRKRKAGWRSRPWFTYFITLVDVAVFCGELARNAQLQGSPIGIHPVFNPMLGPSTDVLVNMGARFVPCMRPVDTFHNDDPNQLYPCPNRTTALLECSLAEWCGFDGRDIPNTLPGGKSSGKKPNQWYRFIIPMFMHAGLIHLGFNMFIQVTLGGDMEKAIGVFRYIAVYFSSGIFGFVLGGNLGKHAQPPAVGASGSLFGIFALCLLDLLYTWRERPKPTRDLIFIMIDILFAFIIGLLPVIDNFSHMGGFLCGLALGPALMRSPNQLRRKIGMTLTDPPYTPANASNPYNSSTGENQLIGFRGFIKQPVAFFKGRKPLWWAWWLVRAAMLSLVLIAFIVLLNNFYSDNMKECSWCQYLDCIPIKNWCSMYDDFKVTKVSENPSRLLARSVPADMSAFL